MTSGEAREEFNVAPYKVQYTEVTRSQSVVDARNTLPILRDEHNIMDSVINSHVTVICGDTGSGKSTQVPQFLYEAGFARSVDITNGSSRQLMIAVTQPRRIAAVNVAKRIDWETGSRGLASYHTAEVSNVHQGTRIKVLTDGILVRELQDDFLLSRYDVVCIDEVHERNLNMDILIGILSRVLGLRERLHASDPNIRPLRLVLMSATMDVEGVLGVFTSAAKKEAAPRVIRVEGRMHEVVQHFSKVTEEDYVKDAARVIRRIHKSLPPGDILCFLPGRREILDLIERMSNEHEDKHAVDSDDERSNANILPASLQLLPLYSSLATFEQDKVFREGEDKSIRRCIIATNIAETSLTIPGIVYVVDSGRTKYLVYDPAVMASDFRVDWASKASAKQRKGRAGRCAKGHYYALYSSAVFEAAFPEHPLPEVSRSPVENLVLTLKSMGIDRVDSFPLPTRPSRKQILAAEVLLKQLGALDVAGKITTLGRTLQQLPVHPSHALLVHMSIIKGSTEVGPLTYAVTYLVAVIGNLKRATESIRIGGNPHGCEIFPAMLSFLSPEFREGEQSKFEVDVKATASRILRSVQHVYKVLANPVHAEYDSAILLRRIRKLISQALPQSLCTLAGPGDLPEAIAKKADKRSVFYRRLHDNTLFRLSPRSAFRKHPPRHLCFFESFGGGEDAERVPLIDYVCAVEPKWLPPPK